MTVCSRWILDFLASLTWVKSINGMNLLPSGQMLNTMCLSLKFMSPWIAIVELVLTARELVEHISKTDLAKAQGIKIDSSLSNSNNLKVFWVFYHKTTQFKAPHILYFPTIFKLRNFPETLICFRPDIYPDHCGMLNGSAGDFFPSYPEQTFVDLFSPDLCR
jgi:hypothetical protein